MVGMQTDVGVIDISAKVLQAGIITGSSYLIIVEKRLERASTNT
jgi:hypothetical protein